MTVSELKNIFPYDLSEIPLTDSSREESIEETEKLRGKKWDQVEHIIIASFEMPYWLSPQAYHYYFPAYIVAAQHDFERSSLAVDYVLSVLTTTNNVNQLKWRMKRWSLFNRAQWGLIESWLNWVEIMDRKELVLEKKIVDVKTTIGTQDRDSLNFSFGHL